MLSATRPPAAALETRCYPDDRVQVLDTVISTTRCFLLYPERPVRTFALGETACSRSSSLPLAKVTSSSLPLAKSPKFVAVAYKPDGEIFDLFLSCYFFIFLFLKIQLQTYTKNSALFDNKAVFVLKLFCFSISQKSDRKSTLT